MQASLALEYRAEGPFHTPRSSPESYKPPRFLCPPPPIAKSRTRNAKNQTRNAKNPAGNAKKLAIIAPHPVYPGTSYSAGAAEITHASRLQFVEKTAVTERRDHADQRRLLR